MSNCESATCCSCPPESEAVLKRDGVLCLVCLECNREKGPAPEITQIACAAPCGSDVPHQWGGPL